MKTKQDGHLKNARVYLAGPMDFVASRAEEKERGWRIRVREFLQSYGATVFDPWEKPQARGLHEYGREDVPSAGAREKWTFANTAEGAKTRVECAQVFWETMHIDLRMVDISDFIIAYCPTNIYSVGTPHEIITACNQHKPVLFVSPPVNFPALSALEKRMTAAGDKEGLALLEKLKGEVPIKSNPRGIPSLWYMSLIGGNSFFDGFGFADYREEYGWGPALSDAIEDNAPPKRPLLEFLAGLNKEIPKRWNTHTQKFDTDDDWLLLNT